MKPWEKYQSGPWTQYQSAKSTTAQPKPASEPTGGFSLHGLGRATAQDATSLATGIAKLGDTIESPITYLLDKVGIHTIPMAQTVQSAAHDIGVPKPANAAERIAQKTGEFLGPTLATWGVGGLLNGADNATAQAVGNALRSNPVQQFLSASAAGAADQTAKEGGLGPLGQTAASFTAGMLVPTLARPNLEDLMALKSLNAPRDAIIASAKKEGYSIPPTQVRHSVGNMFLEGFSGKATTAQKASLKNQMITNGLVRKALGMKPSEPITPEVLSSIRRNAGKAYDAVANSGTITSDNKFARDVLNVASKYQTAGDTFGVGNQDIQAAAAKILEQKQFPAKSAIDLIKVLRDRANATNDNGVSSAYRDLANAVENVVGRNLARQGKMDLLSGFQNARKSIAKTYAVEKALNPADGNVDARKLASQLRSGRPLTGELKKVAKFGLAFPKAAQDVSKTGSIVGFSPFDFMFGVPLGGMGAELLHVPGLWALPFLRPGIRSAILSKPYQAEFVNPSYRAGLMYRAKDALKNRPAALMAPVYGNTQR